MGGVVEFLQQLLRINLNLMNKLTNLKVLKSRILQLLEEVKARKIKTLDLKKKSSFTDYLIISEGTSSRHVNSIIGKISKELKKNVISIEGLPLADWALIDFGDVVLHVFKPEIREHYNLEKIWSDHSPNEKKSFG